MDALSKYTMCPGMRRSKNAPNPIAEILNQEVFILAFVFSSIKML